MVDLTTQLRNAETALQELRINNDKMSGEESRREEELQLCKKELEIYKYV